METRLCARCGRPVTRRPCLFRHPPERTFCGKRCAAQNTAERTKMADQLSSGNPKRRGRPPGLANPNGGRRRTLPGKKHPLFLAIEPDLYKWIKQQPPGTAEKILRQAQIDALDVT